MATPKPKTPQRIKTGPSSDRQLRFYPDHSTYIEALRLNPEYQKDKLLLSRAPFFPSELPEKNERFLQGQLIRRRMKAARVPSQSKWHVAEAVQILPVKRRKNGRTIILSYLRDKRFLTIRINPAADKNSILREAWDRIKRYQRRGSNKNPLLSTVQLEKDGSITIEVDVTATHHSFDKRLWMAIRPFRVNRADRILRGHFSSPSQDLAVLRNIQSGTTVHAQAKLHRQANSNAAYDSGVDSSRQIITRARNRANRLKRQAYPAS